MTNVHPSSVTFCWTAVGSQGEHSQALGGATDGKRDQAKQSRARQREAGDIRKALADELQGEVHGGTTAVQEREEFSRSQVRKMMDGWMNE